MNRVVRLTEEGGSRNPKWSRQELILALELYFRHRPDRISKKHPAVIELSHILNGLPIHSERPDAVRFRNANGVYMKLCNFLRFDPTYSGKGLTAGGADEAQIWEEFANNRSKLTAAAAQILQGASAGVLPGERRYWAACSNPRTFRITQALRNGVSESSWVVKRAAVRLGDRLIMWKAKGGEKERGIVALAEVISPPEVRPVHLNQYWVPSKKPAQARQVRLRFVLPRNAPLWLGHGHDKVLSKLSVARATGGGIFKVAPDQWEAALEVLGGWPDEQDEVAAVLDKLQAVKEGRSGQGFSGSQEQRRAVEKYAVLKARAYFERQGFLVREKGKPYDLRCTKGEQEHFVEVKGTCTRGETVFLTRNEVRFAREHRGHVSLFIVCDVKTREQNGSIIASGGLEKLYEEWDVDAGELEPMAFEYRPQRH